MTSDSMTVLDAHNACLERAYRTSCSSSYENNGPAKSVHLIEESDVARTLSFHFKDELASIGYPITPSAEIAHARVPRRSLRYFYLYFPTLSFDEKAIFPLERTVILRNALAGRTIYKYPTIMVLREGSEQLDSARYKLAKRSPNLEESRARALISSQENHVSGRVVTLGQAPRSEQLNSKELKCGMHLCKFLRRWISGAEEEFQQPNSTTTSRSTLLNFSQDLAQRLCKFSTLNGVVGNSSKTTPYFQVLVRLDKLLCDSIDSQRWNSEAYRSIYYSLKDHMQSDPRSLGSEYRGLRLDSPFPTDLGEAISIPETLLVSLARILNGFSSNLKDASLKKTIMNPSVQPEKSNKRKRTNTTSTQLSVPGHDSGDMEEELHHQTRKQAARSARILENAPITGFENPTAPRVSALIKQETQGVPQIVDSQIQKAEIFGMQSAAERLKHQNKRFAIDGDSQILHTDQQVNSSIMAQNSPISLRQGFVRDYGKMISGPPTSVPLMVSQPTSTSLPPPAAAGIDKTLAQGGFINEGRQRQMEQSGESLQQERFNQQDGSVSTGAAAEDWLRPNMGFSPRFQFDMHGNMGNYSNSNDLDLADKREGTSIGAFPAPTKPAHIQSDPIFTDNGASPVRLEEPGYWSDPCKRMAPLSFKTDTPKKASHASNASLMVLKLDSSEDLGGIEYESEPGKPILTNFKQINAVQKPARAYNALANVDLADSHGIERVKVSLAKSYVMQTHPKTQSMYADPWDQQAYTQYLPGVLVATLSLVSRRSGLNYASGILTRHFIKVA